MRAVRRHRIAGVRGTFRRYRRRHRVRCRVGRRSGGTGRSCLSRGWGGDRKQSAFLSSFYCIVKKQSKGAFDWKFDENEQNYNCAYYDDEEKEY